MQQTPAPLVATGVFWGVAEKTGKECLAILIRGRVLSNALDFLWEETTMEDLGKGEINHEFETIK